MDITHITSLLGGVALFLYGMSIAGCRTGKAGGGKMGRITAYLYHHQSVDLCFCDHGVIRSSAAVVRWLFVGLVNSLS